MRLRRRVARLGERLPEPRPEGVPTDRTAVLAGLLAGKVALDDFDRTATDQVSALAVAAATLLIAQAEDEKIQRRFGAGDFLVFGYSVGVTTMPS